MIPESFIIILPLPPKVLSPNWVAGSIGTRFAKAAAIKKQKRLVAEAIDNECIETCPWPRIEVSVRYFHKINRHRDEDNAMGALKAAYDGIVLSGLVADDDWKHMARKIPTFHIDPEHPRVEMILTKIEKQS